MKNLFAICLAGFVRASINCKISSADHRCRVGGPDLFSRHKGIQLSRKCPRKEIERQLRSDRVALALKPGYKSNCTQRARKLKGWVLKH